MLKLLHVQCSAHTITMYINDSIFYDKTCLNFLTYIFDHLPTKYELHRQRFY